MRIFGIFFLFLLGGIFLGCQSATHNNSRQPSSIKAVEFDKSKTSLLDWAAQNRILFQFPDATLEDVTHSQLAETCRTLKSPAWSDAVFLSLSTMKKNPSLQNKVHVVEIRHSNQTKVETSKDLDGLVYLILNYTKKETKSEVKNFAQIPCDSKKSEMIGQERTDVVFQLPTEAMISKALKGLSPRTMPDRWNYNTEFLQYLAGKMTILRFSAELGFERSMSGDFFLAQYLNEQAASVKQSEIGQFDYWLSEISQRSHTGAYLNLFALVPDKQLSYGMHVVNNAAGLAYPFVTYRSQEGHYTYTSLNDLNQCLDELSMRYKRSIASIRPDYSTQSDSFLSPGYICRLNKP